MDGRVLVRVQKLDRIFNRDDVVVVRFVDQIDDGGQRRTLAAAGWSSDQHNPILDIDDLLQLFRQIEVVELRRTHRDHAHDNRVGAALLEDVHAKTCFTRSTERQVGRTSLLETLSGVLLIANDQLGDSRRMGRGEFFQSGNSYRHQFSGQFDLRWPSGAKNQIADFV